FDANLIARDHTDRWTRDRAGSLLPVDSHLVLGDPRGERGDACLDSLDETDADGCESDRDGLARRGSSRPLPHIRRGPILEHGRTNASSPRDGHRRHLLQGEGPEGPGPMVPPSSGNRHRGYGGPVHVAEWEGR